MGPVWGEGLGDQGWGVPYWSHRDVPLDVALSAVRGGRGLQRITASQVLAHSWLQCVSKPKVS